MIQKIDEAGLKLRIIILSSFILASAICAVFCACNACDLEDEPENLPSIIALWPPDMIPHPPHFPDPTPKPSGPYAA